MIPGKADRWSAARTVAGGKLLSIVMPAYNLADRIAANIRIVHDVMSGSGLDFEIVAVDDGSRDDTSGAIRRLAAAMPRLKPVQLKVNAGKGAALKRGFQASKGDFVLFLDADLDLPVDQAAHFFSTMESARADIVIGCKMHPDSELRYPLHRRIMSRTYFALVKTLIGLPVRDTQTGIKLFRRAALDASFPRMLVKQYAFDLELLAIAHDFGFKIAEAPVRLDFQARSYPFSVKAIMRIAIDTLAIFYRTKILRYYKSIPLRSMPNPPPLISVIIACPAYSEYLEECIQAILLQTYGNFEVMILPDGVTGKAWPDARIKEIPTGAIRPAEKRNIGIREAKGEICAFLDDDAFPAEDWLQNAALYFSAAEVGAVGGPAVTPPNDPLLAQVSGNVFASPLVSGGYRYRYTAGRVREVEDFPSCNLIVKTSTVRDLNGFRTDFWPGEDTFLCMDIVHKSGRKIIYDPRILVYHHRRNVFLPHLRQVGRYALHRGYFARKFPATSRKLSYFVPSLFVAGVLSGAAASCFLPALRPAYIISMLIYGAIALLFSFSLSPVQWVLGWLGTMATHIVYGIRFVIGILSKQMPETVALFDHPSEKQ